MKFLISILLISSVGLLTNYSAKENSEEMLGDCSCSGMYCYSSANCGVDYYTSCNCGITCLSWCQSKDEPNAEKEYFLPNATKAQKANSIATQGYFESLGTEEGQRIAKNFEEVRTALETKNLENYINYATALEQNFAKLSKIEQTNFYNWGTTNLTLED